MLKAFEWGANMATNVKRVRESAPGVGHTTTEPQHLAVRTISVGMRSIQFKILAQLATKATDAKGYAALQVAGYDITTVDDAIEALHNAGLINAFFVDQAARPRYHPSSLTGDGRRIYEHYLRSAGG